MCACGWWGKKWAWSIGCGPERVLQVSEAYVDVSNWLPINKNLDLDTQHSIKLPKTTVHYVRTWPIMRKNGRGQTGNFPVDNLRAPGEIRLFRPSRGLKKIFRLLLKFADNEPILCITDQTISQKWFSFSTAITQKIIILQYESPRICYKHENKEVI